LQNANNEEDTMKRTWITAAALGIGSMATLWAPAASAQPNGPKDFQPVPKPSISISDASVSEGNAGTKLLHFSVTLSKSSAQKITANVQTIGAVSNPATANVDYSSKFAILEFAPGDTAKNFSVTIKGDKSFEADEHFGASITNVSNATMGKQNGMGTIVNDDFGVIQPPKGDDPQPEPPADDPKPPADPEPADNDKSDDTPAPKGAGGGSTGGGSTGGSSTSSTSTTAAPTGEQALGTDGTAAVASEDGDSLMTWLVVVTAGLAGAVALILLWPPRRRRSA
jgi:hypothetical protein